MALPITTQLANNIVMSHYYKRATISDSTQNGNDGTFGGNTYWVNSSRGKALDFDGSSGSISVADSATIQDIFDGGGTFAGWIKPRSDGEVSGRIIDKSQSASEGYILALTGEASGVSKLRFYQVFDGTDGDWITTSTEIPNNEWTHIAVTYDADSVSNSPVFYVNGVALTVGSGLTETLTPTGTRVTDVGNDLYIGNMSNDSRTFDGAIGEALLFNTTLTDQQMSQLYDEESTSGFFGDLPTKTFLPEQTELIGSPVVAFDMNKQGATVYDVSGSATAYDGTVTGCSDVEGMFGRALHFNGDTDNVSTTWDVASNGTMSFSAWLKFDQLASDLGRRCYIFSTIYQHNANDYLYIQGTNDFHSAGADIKAGVWFHLVYTQAGQSDTTKMYINGEDVSTAIGGAESITAITNMFLGRREADNTNNFNGCMDAVRAYDTELSQAQVTELYEQGQSKLNINKTGEDWNVSTGNVTAGFLENTGFEVDSGSWQVDDSSGSDGKQITCVAAGELSIPSQQAFGTWEFEFNKGAATVIRFMFVASEAAVPLAGTNDGYYIVVNDTEIVALTTVTNGSGVNNFLTDAAEVTAGNWIKVTVTRDADGTFSAYFQDITAGGSPALFTATTGTNPISETTFTTSLFTVIEMDATDAVRNFKYWPTIQDPTA